MHSLLKRQLRRHLGGSDSLPAEWRGFVEAVNNAYVEADTDRRMLERSLELSSQELLRANSEMRAVFERLIYSSVDGIFAFDRQCRYTVWNPALQRILGLSRLQTLGKSAFEVFPLLRETGRDEVYRDALAGKTVVARDSLYVGRGTGEQIEIEAHFSPLLSDSNEIIGGLAILRDVTERKRAEDALRHSEAYLAEAQRVSHTGSFGWSVPDGKIVWSAETFRIFQYDPQNSEPTVDVVLQRTHPEDVALVRQVIDRGARDGQDWSLEHRLLMPDGAVKYVHVVAHASHDESGKLDFVGAVMDVTERRRAEAALHQARAELAHVTRVTTLGELAASIAHEVNQPLAAIVADANACLHWLAADPPDLAHTRETLAAVVKDGNRAAEVITRIRALLSRSSVVHRPCDVARVIGAVLPLVGPELGRHGIILKTSLAPGVPLVMGDQIQLQQVLLNLLLNAAEAVREVSPERRRLVVRLARERRDDGAWAVVAVEDAGVGFREDEAARLYEAFYTTKPGGLGMGLSISRSIIEGHGGRLWATANPEYGATFQFALPGMR
jgi:PAS domain S-box-containing protein